MKLTLSVSFVHGACRDYEHNSKSSDIVSITFLGVCRVLCAVASLVVVARHYPPILQTTQIVPALFSHLLGSRCWLELPRVQVCFLEGFMAPVSPNGVANTLPLSQGHFLWRSGPSISFWNVVKHHGRVQSLARRGLYHPAVHNIRAAGLSISVERFWTSPDSCSSILPRAELPAPVLHVMAVVFSLMVVPLSVPHRITTLGVQVSILAHQKAPTHTRHHIVVFTLGGCNILFHFMC